MNTIERDTLAYWNASSAYHGRKYIGNIGNVGNLIAVLRSICLISNWRLASFAGRLLEDVIEDRLTTNECPAEVIPLLPKGSATEYTDFLQQVISKQK